MKYHLHKSIKGHFNFQWHHGKTGIVCKRSPMRSSGVDWAHTPASLRLMGLNAGFVSCLSKSCCQFPPMRVHPAEQRMCRSPVASCKCFSQMIGSITAGGVGRQWHSKRITHFTFPFHSANKTRLCLIKSSCSAEMCWLSSTWWWPETDWKPVASFLYCIPLFLNGEEEQHAVYTLKDPSSILLNFCSLSVLRLSYVCTEMWEKTQRAFRSTPLSQQRPPPCHTSADTLI